MSTSPGTPQPTAPQSAPQPTAPQPTPTARQVADRWVETLADLDPTVGTALGIRPGDDRMPDLSPGALAERADAERAALAELETAQVVDEDDRRCAALMRERLGAHLLVHHTGEDLVSLRPIGSPVQGLQSLFLMMPTATADDWAVIARRMAKVPESAESYRLSLAAGLEQGLLSAARQAAAVVEQLTAWLPSEAPGWHTSFVTAHDDGPDLPESLQGDLQRAAERAAQGVAALRDWIAGTYLPAVAAVPDGVGRERYLVAARVATGADIDPEGAYAWGWTELGRIEDEMVVEAERVLPGATPAQALAHLEEHGPAVEGVEAMIAPPGAAAAPYYTRPSLDFSRPGRTWLPTLGRSRFPTWDLISTWYHEGVPGHHLQLGQWAYRANELSRFQVSVGSVSATTEGWALYAERLADELGYLADPGARLGYLDGQRMRAVRVVIDIGMHLGLPIPAMS